MLGIANYFWRLIPANPILLRVVEGGSKRKRDLFFRCGYLGILVFVVIFSLVSVDPTKSFTALTTTSVELFQSISLFQLAAVALLAPVFTAGAITQEKDSQTYDILLATPLTNGQIVLGSLMSRVFFIVALLISGIPIFSITQIFGGVAISSIVMSFLVSAATAMITGALAMAIAVFKVGTRRTIFSFYLFIVLYLGVLFLLDRVPYFQIVTGQVQGKDTYISWFTGLHPFLALRVIFNDPTYRAADPGSAAVAGYPWPITWYLTNPASFYVTFMFTLSFVLVTPSILLLRRLAQSTGTVRGWFLQKLHLSTGDRTRKPRPVWSNPIAWREAKTKASAARATFLRYSFIILGLGGAIVLLAMHSTERSDTAYTISHPYNPETNTLTIIKDGQSKDYPLPTPRPQVQIEGADPIDIDQLHGRYAIDVNANGTFPPIIELHDLRHLSADVARSWLLGAVAVEFAVILLIITNAAASTVTREKEDGTLDLLLSTPITSRYYIWGKLRGLVSFVLPLLAVPIISIGLFVLHDLIRWLSGDSEFNWVALPTAILALPPMLIIVSAFAAILGMQMSLRCRTTVWAVMSSVGIVVGICFGLGACGLGAANNSSMDAMGPIIGAFSPFTLLCMLIDPGRFAGANIAVDQTSFYANTRMSVATAQVLLLIVGWLAAGGYSLIVWAMYKSMVKNFDMTIRRQSR